MYALEAKNVTKQYQGGVKALNGLTFQVRQGEIFTLLGPNGAGKSTLINILTTYLKPTSGEVIMLGRDLFSNPDWARTQIACVAQQISIDTHLSLMENMRFQSRLHQVGTAEATKRISRMIDTLHLTDYLKHPTASYSGGVKRRLDIAMNMVSLPRILFLDEPTAGMDVQSRKAMWEMLATIRNEFGTTIFLTTHYLEEADTLSDTICIMKNGTAVTQGSPRELRGIINQNMLRIQFSDYPKAKQQLAQLCDKLPVHSQYLRGKDIIAVVESGAQSLPAITRVLLDLDVPFTGIEIAEPSLEDVFLTLTEKEACLS